VLIVDPHIKASDEYFVYSDGMKYQLEDSQAGNYSNIFIRESGPNIDKPFYG